MHEYKKGDLVEYWSDDDVWRPGTIDHTRYWTCDPYPVVFINSGDVDNLVCRGYDGVRLR